MQLFKDIKVGTLLEYNGVLYQKKTSRTALMVHNKRVFYFGINDECSTDKKVINNLINKRY